LLEPHRKDLGGFVVGRVLPQVARRMVGPFVFFDHFGPATFPPNFPKNADVRPHPHIGLSTVTYLFDGAITHRDSVGVTQEIAPGEVNWMVSGRGITHSERFEKLRPTGGLMHGIQAWVALPTADEETDPSFVHVDAAEMPTYEHGGLWARLIAGKAFGATSPVKTHSPMFYVHWALKAGAEAQLEDEYPERAVFVAQGAVTVDGRALGTGQMLVLDPGAPSRVKAETDSIVMLLGGEPVGPRFVEWNFVSSTKARIEQAKADWRAGRIKLPDADNQEFIPRPDPPPAPPPMS
jgi:redox-sensitive bicupin YhaK (pirin superfamily)